MNYFATREEKKKGLPGLLELVDWSDDVWTRLLLPSLFFSLLCVFPCVGFFSAFLFLCSLHLTPCSLGLFLRSWPLVPLCYVLLFPYDFFSSVFFFFVYIPWKTLGSLCICPCVCSLFSFASLNSVMCFFVSSLPVFLCLHLSPLLSVVILWLSCMIVHNLHDGRLARSPIYNSLS